MVQILCEAAYNTAFRVFALILANAAARVVEPRAFLSVLHDKQAATRL